ncbi:Gp37-like protein [Corynebacterium variabile]|uniref:Gp37-like protein n=1 Tax=Corynebacterium variabile TaxID=1727 RepID=UPI0028985508|nr:hypothetical protein [Corynebacterium variabile]
MVTNTLDLRVWNNEYTRWLPIRGYISAEFNDECGFTAPTGTLTVPADHPRATRLMQGSSDVVPVTLTTEGGYEWTGSVDTYTAEGKPGREILTLDLIHDKSLLHIPAWPSTRTPLEMQTKRDYQVGRLATVCTHFLTENLARVGTPAYVMLPTMDNSPIVDVAAKMTYLDELLGDLLDKHDYVLRCEMWWPGKPFPQGKVAALVGRSTQERQLHLTAARVDAAVRPFGGPIVTPTVPGLVVSVEQVRNREHVRFSSNGRDVEQFKLTGRKPGPHTAIVGGKSDDWVNELVEMAIDASAQAILIALGSTAGPLGALLAGAISNIIVNQLTDTLIAYQQRTDVERKATMGPFAPTESFTSSSAGAYTFDTSALAERQLLEDAGGQAIEITIADGVSKVLGDDQQADNGKWRLGWRPGDRVTFEEHLSGVVVSDIITGVTITDQVGQRMRITPKVGKTRNRNNAFTDFVDVLSKVTSVAADMGLQG